MICWTNTRLLCVASWVLGCVQLTTGLQLSDCSGTVDVEENSVKTVTCLGTPENLLWHLQYVIAASCDNSTCTVNEGFSHVLVIRPNASASVLHVDVTKYRNVVLRVTCDSGQGHNARCYFRSVYTETPTSCQFNVTKSSGTVSGACQIDKIYASNNYKCRWKEVYNDQTDKTIQGAFDSTLYTDSETGRQYRRGVCAFSSTFFAVQGVFKYTHHMDPGFPVYVATMVVYDSSNITVSGPLFVTTSVDGFPGIVEVITTTTTTTTSTTTTTTTPTTTATTRMITPTTTDSDVDPTTSTSSTPSATGPTSESDASEKTPGTEDDANDSNITAYVAGSLGLIIIVVIVVFGVLILRKISDAKKGPVDGSGGEHMASVDVSRPSHRERTERQTASIAEPEHIYSETYAEPLGIGPEEENQSDSGCLNSDPSYITPIPDNYKV